MRGVLTETGPWCKGRQGGRRHGANSRQAVAGLPGCTGAWCRRVVLRSRRCKLHEGAAAAGADWSGCEVDRGGGRADEDRSDGADPAGSADRGGYGPQLGAESTTAADGDGVLVTVPRGKTEPGGRDEGRAVREGRRRPRHPDAASCGKPGGRRTASCHSRRRWWGCGSRRRPGRR